MANTIKILFWLRRTKINKDGQVPLMIRLTFQKEKVDKASGYYILPETWNSTKQQLKGNKISSTQINDWINSKIAELATVLKDDEHKTNIHLPSIMERLFAKTKVEPTLLKTIEEYNQQLKAKVNKGVSFSTYEKYVFTQNKVKGFINTYLKKKDIILREITTKFIMEFDHYLRVNDNNQHNTAVKYCINLKRILNVAVMQGVIDKSPLNSFKTVYRDTPQIYLSEAEVEAIEKVNLKKNSHVLVRDLFIFQCNTGFAYTDMIALKFNDISIDNNGGKWVIKERQKTGIVSTVPLLVRALEIIEKYKFSQADNDKLFPHYSIQKYNQYIGEVGLIAEINKKLSSHVGRRTFGNVALSKGISINVISKILGHSSTLITQRIYAITTQNIISKEIDKW